MTGTFYENWHVCSAHFNTFVWGIFLYSRDTLICIFHSSWHEHTTSWEINTLNCNKIYQQWFCKLFFRYFVYNDSYFLIFFFSGLKINIMNNSLLFSSKVIGHFNPPTSLKFSSIQPHDALMETDILIH